MLQLLTPRKSTLPRFMTNCTCVGQTKKMQQEIAIKELFVHFSLDFFLIKHQNLNSFLENTVSLVKDYLVLDVLLDLLLLSLE